MKICPNCNCQLDDNAAFCTGCGTPFVAPQPVPVVAAPVYDPYDHTAEFDPKDISDNKVIAMLVYLMGPIGIIIALLAGSTSPYAGFHVRQALKFTATEILATIALILCAVIAVIPYLGWFIYAVAAIAYVGILGTLTVLKFICFFQICKGQAKEAAIIRNLKFMR